ncbi:cyclic-di-AMP receptor [Deinococcus sp. Marseille-Q6407]|uniref:cyclic-di-AMP receptor n=1 Tax=Deinococcus sp. Marseille-Q6407 TaxID=2969223 RepID=UPI0021C1EB9E|nr:cyclic-di-AMP receptor [Deinococcus sp. Marseille-Q6407]
MPYSAVPAELLVLAVIQDADVPKLMRALAQARLDVTRLSSSGGFLREGNTTLMIGVSRARLDELKDLISLNCRTRSRMMSPAIPLAEQGEGLVTEPLEVEVGGAVLFVLGVQEFVKL